MEIIDYLDFDSIYKKVKSNHLANFPTPESYIKYLEGLEEDFSYVNEMYDWINNPAEDTELPTSENKFDNEVIFLDKGLLCVEFTIGGNDANESTNHNEWGYGWEFVIDLEEEIFIGFTENNYS